MIYQAHKGVSSDYPENTFPALIAAVEEGYGTIELDVGVTKDKRFVLLHDKTLNRTARTKVGEPLDREIKIADITLAEAEEYDFGVWKDERFLGTKLPLFDDVLKFAKENGIPLKIDNKYEAFTDNERDAFFQLIAPYEDVACLTCKSLGALEYASRIFSKMHFHYDGRVTEKILTRLSQLLPRERLTVWLPLKNSLTSWVKTEFADEELTRLVKRHARLGIWILSEYSELDEAERLGAAIIETNGQLKPPRGADMHTHSENSHDSLCPVEEMLLSQRARGTQVFAVTDHFDTDSYQRYDVFTPIKKAHEAVGRSNELYPDMTVLRGVEISEGFWHPEVLKDIYSLSYDVIIGSVHLVRYEGYRGAYSAIDFSSFSDEELHAYLDAYFDDVIALLDTTDFDILAHLTCPLRYIVGKYKRTVNIDRYSGKIGEILRRVIADGKALEINTSSLALLGDTMPGIDIIREYKSLGGELVTVGSDAHVSENASYGFKRAMEMLKSLGFGAIYYYKNRKPYKINI